MEARAAGARSDAKVCRRASAAEEPSATLRTSEGVLFAMSTPSETGRRPEHVYTLTSEGTPQGHPKLSLEWNVTVL